MMKEAERSLRSGYTADLTCSPVAVVAAPGEISAFRMCGADAILIEWYPIHGV